MQLDDLLVTFEASLPPLAAEWLRACQSWVRWCCWRMINRSRSVLPESLFDHRGMTRQDVLQRFAEIAQEMETICDLHGVRRAQAGSFGIGPSTIAAIAVMALFAPQIRAAVANELEVAAFHLDDSRATIMEGKLLCRDCLLKDEYGYNAMCPTRGHHGSLQTKDGKIWQILDGEASEELIRNSKLLGRTVRIHGRCFRRASSIEVESYEVL